jgi:nucleoside-diphosphate-sugar epimerase
MAIQARDKESPLKARIGVTGATGFIGHHLLLALAQRGYEVIPLVRKASRLAHEVVIGDISAASTPIPADVTLDAVIHLAGVSSVPGRKPHERDAKLHTSNVAGTRWALALAKRAGACHFLFLSSVKVNGESTPLGQPFHESDEPRPETSYGSSKLEAEQIVKTEAGTHPFSWTIIRPPLVYGQGARGNFGMLAKLARSGLPLPFRAIDNARSLVSVDNLVSALTLCLEHPQAKNKTFFVSDREDLSTPQLIEELASAQGGKALQFSVGPKFIKLVARILGLPDVATRLCDSLQVDTSEIHSQIGWSPQTSLHESFMRNLSDFTRANRANME